MSGLVIAFSGIRLRMYFSAGFMYDAFLAWMKEMKDKMVEICKYFLRSDVTDVKKHFFNPWFVHGYKFPIL